MPTLPGSWATGRDGKRDLPFVLPEGTEGPESSVWLAYEQGDWPGPGDLGQLRRNGPTGTPLEAGVHSWVLSLVSYKLRVTLGES